MNDYFKKSWEQSLNFRADYTVWKNFKITPTGKLWFLTSNSSTSANLPNGEDKIILRNDSAAQDREMHWEICHLYL